MGMSATHPPSVVRRQFALDRIVNGTDSFDDVFYRHTGKRITADFNSPNIPPMPSGDLYDSFNGQFASLDAMIFVELLPMLDALAADIYVSAENTLRAKRDELVYTPARLDRDLSDYLDDLCALIPPIERQCDGGAEAATLAGIMNVGAAALLTRMNDFGRGSFPEADDAATAHKIERLHELLLKAVELSEARRMWEES